MTIGTDVVRGAIKIDNFMEGRRFTSLQDFIQALPSILAVEIPTGITNVTVGPQQPSDSERGNLWIQQDASGSFIGLFVYAQGAWRKIYPAPNQLFKMHGDSRDIPDGFTLASADPNIATDVVAKLQTEWVIGGTSPTWYKLFHCTYTGF